MVERIQTRTLVDLDTRFAKPTGFLNDNELPASDLKGLRETPNFAIDKPKIAPHDIDKMIADAEAHRVSAEQGRAAMELRMVPVVEAPLTRRESLERERKKGRLAFLKNALK